MKSPKVTSVCSWTEWPWQQRGRLCMSLMTWTSTYQGWLGSDHCCVPNRPVAEISSESSTWHSPLEWPASCLVAGELHWISITDMATFWSYWNRPLIWVWIFFPCKYISSKTATRGLQNFCGLWWYLTQHGIQPRNLLHSKKCDNGPLLREFTGVTITLLHWGR